ncbi:MAG TPA: hypothetical protein DCM87_02970 [Planctomycetes bacterium]|jgi:hypothetical protein|nr:hypothetical protein [Planctomycetota bacterium]
MESDLKPEFEFYLANQKDLVKKYRGRFVVIKDCKVIGDYASELDAVQETVKKGHALGTFLVQKCAPGQDSYTQVFHSRAAFA